MVKMTFLAQKSSNLNMTLTTLKRYRGRYENSLHTRNITIILKICSNNLNPFKVVKVMLKFDDFWAKKCHFHNFLVKIWILLGCQSDFFQKLSIQNFFQKKKSNFKEKRWQRHLGPSGYKNHIARGKLRNHHRYQKY